jgi:L-ribulokinase
VGSAIFAFLAAGSFKTLDEAQAAICPKHTVFAPQPEAQKVYADLYELYRRIYFDFGRPEKDNKFGGVLPKLIQLARGCR